MYKVDENFELVQTSPVTVFRNIKTKNEYHYHDGEHLSSVPCESIAKAVELYYEDARKKSED